VTPAFRARTAASDAAAEYVEGAVPAGRTPWRLAHFCVVDLELSGLDPRSDEILSFAVPIDAGRVIAGNAVYGLCRNTHPLPEESVLVHWIRTVDLADAPPLDEAIAPLVSVMSGRILVAHAAWIERSFLAPVLKHLGLRLHRPVIDTRDLGELLALERGQAAGPTSLSGLAHSLGLPVHRPHHALGDALTTAQVFIALATHLDVYAAQTVRSLGQAKRRAQSLALYPPARRAAGRVAGPCASSGREASQTT
jgi:DNA polymerase-3 subunit epsilon